MFTQEKPPLAELAHHGVKGQKWGVRKAEAPAGTLHKVQGSDAFPEATAKGVENIGQKMADGYGFPITHVVPIRANERGEANTLAYVQLTATKEVNVIHIRSDPGLHDVTKQLGEAGWLAAGPDHPIEGLITHESAHALLHQSELVPTSLGRTILLGPKIVGNPNEKAITAAWKAAKTQAIKDGDAIPKKKGLRGIFKPAEETQMAAKLSNYAKLSMWREEAEAEMFASYHWNPNPPKFVDAWMTELHSQMGKTVPPFSGRKLP